MVSFSNSQLRHYHRFTYETVLQLMVGNNSIPELAIAEAERCANDVVKAISRRKFEARRTKRRFKVLSPREVRDLDDTQYRRYVEDFEFVMDRPFELIRDSLVEKVNDGKPKVKNTWWRRALASMARKGK